MNSERQKSLVCPRLGTDLVQRWEGNPLISVGDLGFKCSDILNAGVACFKDQILLLVTIEHPSGRRHIHLGRPDGDGAYTVEEQPFISPSTEPEFAQHERHGVLDARVTFIDGAWHIVYNALGFHGYRLALARTTDFESVERLGLISQPDVKAGVLFGEKFNGRFARLERPEHGQSIWITYSDDLVYWGGSQLVISPRPGFWDSCRVGMGPAPIAIEQGWLALYYGAKDTSAGPIYRMGAVILDRYQPTKVVARANIPILSPRENYERVGDIPNLVFSAGAYLDDDGTLNIIYGASDSCVCLGTTTVQKIVDNCYESSLEY